MDVNINFKELQNTNEVKGDVLVLQDEIAYKLDVSKLDGNNGTGEYGIEYLDIDEISKEEINTLSGKGFITKLKAFDKSKIPDLSISIGSNPVKKIKIKTTLGDQIFILDRLGNIIVGRNLNYVFTLNPNGDFILKKQVDNILSDSNSENYMPISSNVLYEAFEKIDWNAEEGELGYIKNKPNLNNSTDNVDDGIEYLNIDEITFDELTQIHDSGFIVRQKNVPIAEYSKLFTTYPPGTKIKIKTILGDQIFIVTNRVGNHFRGLNLNYWFTIDGNGNFQFMKRTTNYLSEDNSINFNPISSNAIYEAFEKIDWYAKEGELGYIKNKPVIEVERKKKELIFNDDSFPIGNGSSGNGYKIFSTSTNFEMIIGDYYKVEIDNEVYDNLLCRVIDSYTVLTDSNLNSSLPSDGNISIYKSTSNINIAYKTLNSTISISVYHYITKQIDPKYLPIVQETGDSETSIMSQKAITEVINGSPFNLVDSSGNGYISYAAILKDSKSNADTFSVVTGFNSTAKNRSLAEGDNTYAIDYSHAGGSNSYAFNYSQADGYYNSAYNYSNVNGQYSYAVDYSHSEGVKSYALKYSHAEGRYTYSLDHSHAEGFYVSSYNYSHVEGQNSYAYNNSHAEGYYNSAYNYSHSEGYQNKSFGLSHAEGYQNIAGNKNDPNSWKYSHVEGRNNFVTELYGHAEGYYTYNLGQASHIEGFQTNIISNNSHAEGYRTIVNENISHAEGCNNIVNGFSSHVEGYQNIINNIGEHASGKNNLSKTNNRFGIIYQSSNFSSINEDNAINNKKYSSVNIKTDNYFACLRVNLFGVKSITVKFLGEFDSANSYIAICQLNKSKLISDTVVNFVGTSNGKNGEWQEYTFNIDKHGYNFFDVICLTGSKVNNGESNIGTFYISNIEYFNEDYIETSQKTLFSIGNGDDENRHNALEVKENGDLYIPDTAAKGEDWEKPMVKLPAFGDYLKEEVVIEQTLPDNLQSSNYGADNCWSCKIINHDFNVGDKYKIIIGNKEFIETVKIIGQSSTGLTDGDSLMSTGPLQNNKTFSLYNSLSVSDNTQITVLYYKYDLSNLNFKLIKLTESVKKIDNKYLPVISSGDPSTGISASFAPKQNEIIYTTTDGKALGIEPNENNNLVESDEYFENLGFGKITFSENLTNNLISIFNGKKTLKSVILPEGLTNLPYNCFGSCENLEIVELPNSITSFDVDSAYNYGNQFFNCYRLKEINLPNEITEITPYCFYNCSSLNHIYLHNNITKIGSHAFEYSGISNLDLNQVLEIGEFAFRYSQIISLDTKNVKTIGNYGFAWCNDLVTVYINYGLQQLGQNCFEYCKSLSNVNFTENSSFKTIPSSCFFYCTSLNEISIDTNISAIGNSAFYYCPLRSITIHSSSITNYNTAFYFNESKSTLEYFYTRSSAPLQQMNAYLTLKTVILDTSQFMSSIPNLGNLKNYCTIYVQNQLLEQYRETYPNYSGLFKSITGKEIGEITWTGTDTEFELLGEYDNNTIYYIVEEDDDL